jgi:hypothetical protein
MMKNNTAQILAGSAAALSLLLTLASLGAGRRSSDEWLVTHLMFGPATMLTYALVVALVAARHLRSPIGWLLSAEGLFSALTMFASNFDTLSLPSGILIVTMIEDNSAVAAMRAIRAVADGEAIIRARDAGLAQS